MAAPSFPLCHLCLAIFAILCGRARAAERTLFKDSTDVVNLYPTDFAVTVLSDPRAWVVDFYADWCGHCVHFAPIYKSIAAKMSDEKRVRFGALNCAVHHEFCSKIGIRAFPTMKAFHIPDFKGSDTKEGAEIPRKVYSSADSVVKWVRSQLPASWSPFVEKPQVAPADAKHEAATPQAQVAPPQAQTPREPPATTKKSEAPAPEQQQAAAASAASAAPAAGSSAEADAAQLKRARGQTAADRHLWDAKVALLYSLRQGTFLQGAEHSNGTSKTLALEGAALSELCAWLTFVAGALPSPGAYRDVHGFAEVACQAQRRSGALGQRVWSSALAGKGIDGVPQQAGEDPAPYWLLCTTYTCGLWSLFHVLTLSSAEARRNGSASAGAGPFLAPAQAGARPEEALARIRGFVEHFFGCEVCATHFLKTFDSCALGRCALPPGDGKGAALWLWQVHNSVSARVASENGKAPAESWPPKADCPSCWPSDTGGEWEAKSVYQHLRSTYWRPEWSSSSSSPSYVYIEIVAFLCGAVALGYCAWDAVSGGRKRGGRWKRVLAGVIGAAAAGLYCYVQALSVNELLLGR